MFYILLIASSILIYEVLGQTWPDLSCYPFYESNYIEQATKLCTEELSKGNESQLYSNCKTQKCCMLHMLGILYEYKHKNPIETYLETIWMSYKGKESLEEMLKSEIASPKLVQPDFVQKAEAERTVTRLTEDVFQCVRLLILKRKLSDEDWSPLYSCVQSALKSEC